MLGIRGKYPPTFKAKGWLGELGRSCTVPMIEFMDLQP